MTNKKVCIALIADKKYIKHFIPIYKQLRSVGKFDGDIVLITNTNKKKLQRKVNDDSFLILNRKQFRFSKDIDKKIKRINQPDKRNIKKKYQWNKIYLFDKYFKNWDVVLYIDINLRIHDNVNEIFDLYKKDRILAHHDSYPEYKWKLANQFDQEKPEYKILAKNFNLSNREYFQTGLMLYDTSIINSQTINELINLANTYPISKTNEQGVFNLYFIDIKKAYQQLPIKNNEKFIYDYWRREKGTYIISKRDFPSK